MHNIGNSRYQGASLPRTCYVLFSSSVSGWGHRGDLECTTFHGLRMIQNVVVWIVQ